MKNAYGALLPRIRKLTAYTDPHRFERPEEFKDLMLETLQHKASDVFIQAGLPICTIVNGDMMAVTDRPLNENEVLSILRYVTDRDTAQSDILEAKPVNARYELYDPVAKDERGAKIRHGYRINASPIQVHGRTSIQIVMRAIPSNPPHYSDIGISDEIIRAATPRDGIVYIAGPTGSGKTTTFASIIRFILENDTPIKGNLITHEEPIEFTFEGIASKHSILVQSQIPNHFMSFYAANREAMRRKPGLILVGELRDEESIQAAIEASITGHPVFGTVHANNVSTVIRRLLSRFPNEEKEKAINDIIETARLIIAQRLIKGTDNKLHAVREYLIFTEEIRDSLITLSEKTSVTQAVKKLTQEHGQSFASEGRRLYDENLIDERVLRELCADEI